ncbi:hypothetical protein CKF54_00855 [Psittacicella hinzii]|uniref:Uncharacterized protein n=1 Tax=Psittacicella hinzii TaxID=2028575 RepID=A0A3A1Y7X4_9GAMM|nr:phage tail protein [Psittacicella hinzii]RIY34322.1 hypothetical protein CKF54_00855 [Psittacicella hinzii]
MSNQELEVFAWELPNGVSFSHENTTKEHDYGFGYSERYSQDPHGPSIKISATMNHRVEEIIKVRDFLLRHYKDGTSFIVRPMVLGKREEYVVVCDGVSTVTQKNAVEASIAFKFKGVN